MIVFENPGEIDISAITTFGVSVKESDNPIGFFGTGLKYAVAVLLRNGHTVSGWSGTTRLEFGTVTKTIRGKDFEVITLNGQALGFTTEVGKTWKLWMAYRELFCNARDENGDATFAREMPDPMEGHTQIIVRGDEFEGVHHQRWQYFIEDEPDMHLDGMNIWRRPSHAFFYRGVKVMDLPRQAMLTYGDTAKMELTEDRTVKHQYEPPYRIARALLACRDESLLRQILTAKEDCLEAHLDFHGWSSTPPSPEFLRVVGTLVNNGITDVNQTAKKVWQEKQPNEFKPKELQLSKVQQITLERAVDFCNRIGFPLKDEYPVSVVESLGTDTLGLAKGGRIYIAERVFHMGTKQVAATLIEEFVHLRHGYLDCTRSLQNFLLERMVSMGEELVGEPA